MHNPHSTLPILCTKGKNCTSVHDVHDFEYPVNFKHQAPS